MRDLLEFLSANPLILLLILGAVAQGVGGMIKRAAVAKPSRSSRPNRATGLPEMVPVASQPEFESEEVVDPDTVARELERMFELELDPVPVISDVRPVEVVSADPGAVSQPPPVVTRSTAPKRSVRRRRLLDLRNPAAAFVAIEVLGPPKALTMR